MHLLFFSSVLFKLTFPLLALHVNLHVWEWLFDGTSCFGCSIEREEHLCNRGLFVLLEFRWSGSEFHLDPDIWRRLREETSFRKTPSTCEVCDILLPKRRLCRPQHTKCFKNGTRLREKRNYILNRLFWITGLDECFS